MLFQVINRAASYTCAVWGAAPVNCLLILSFRQSLFCYICRENALVNIDELFNLFTIEDLLGGFHEQWSLQRVALNRAVRFAFDHSLEDTLYTIDGDDGDILARFETCSFNSLDSTQSHIIVLSKEDIDLIAIGFEEGFHNFLALLTSELTRLGSKKVVFASILGSSHSILEAFLTADCYGRTNSALELYDIEFIAASRFLVVLSHVLVDPLEDLFAFSNGVRADLGYIEGIIADLYITVNNDNRDLCVLSFFKNCIPARLYNRDKGDDINALGNEGTKVGCIMKLNS